MQERQGKQDLRGEKQTSLWHWLQQYFSISRTSKGTKEEKNKEFQWLRKGKYWENMDESVIRATGSVSFKNSNDFLFCLRSALDPLCDLL